MAEDETNGVHDVDVADVRSNLLTSSTKRRLGELNAIYEKLASDGMPPGRYPS